MSNDSTSQTENIFGTKLLITRKFRREWEQNYKFRTRYLTHRFS